MEPFLSWLESRWLSSVGRPKGKGGSQLRAVEEAAFSSFSIDVGRQERGSRFWSKTSNLYSVRDPREGLASRARCRTS